MPLAERLDTPRLPVSSSTTTSGSASPSAGRWLSWNSLTRTRSTGTALASAAADSSSGTSGPAGLAAADVGCTCGDGAKNVSRVSRPPASASVDATSESRRTGIGGHAARGSSALPPAPGVRLARVRAGDGGGAKRNGEGDPPAPAGTLGDRRGRRRPCPWRAGEPALGGKFNTMRRVRAPGAPAASLLASSATASDTKYAELRIVSECSPGSPDAAAPVPDAAPAPCWAASAVASSTSSGKIHSDGSSGTPVGVGCVTVVRLVSGRSTGDVASPARCASRGGDAYVDPASMNSAWGDRASDRDVCGRDPTGRSSGVMAVVPTCVARGGRNPSSLLAPMPVPAPDCAAAATAAAPPPAPAPAPASKSTTWSKSPAA